MARNYLDLGVPFAVAMTMLRLKQRDFTQREIADLLGVGLKAVNRALALLEAHEMVSRTPAPSGPKRQPQHGHAHFLYRWSGAEIGGQP